ncbi:prevent-host-death family protein [Spirosoma endophyticum]|uniref:Antitoxin n=2 Tax=Spirosoma endophyticum TaxID=662367 RepID=A0A1I2HIM0_9BACT|nr:prevent-host-death family protein [Spirosoma endophyticum]
MSIMENLTMNEFRRQVGEYINQTYYAEKAFVLTKGEKKVAALVPMAMLNRMTELEAFYAQTLADKTPINSSDSEATETNQEAAS